MKTILLVALGLLSLNAAAQSSLKSGYYITAANDTVQVQIKDEDWIRNPNEISIVRQGKPEKLTKAEMSGFGIEQGDVYRKFAVDIDASPITLNNIVIDQQAIILRDTVLLRILVEGAINLYQLRDNDGKLHFYIQKGEEEPKELIYRKVKRVVNGKQMLVTLEPYKGLLQVYLGDCSISERKVQSTAFKTGSLVKIVSEYNRCQQPSQQEYVAKEEKTRWYFGMTAGFGLVKYTFKNEGSYSALAGTDFNSLNPNAALVINMVLPRGHGRWGVSSELGYKKYTMDGRYENYISSNMYSEYDTEFDLQYAAFNTQLVYTIKGDSRLRPFISGGIALNVLVGDNSYQTSTRSSYSITRRYENPPLEDMRKLEQALLMGAGIQYNRFILAGRYELGNGFSPYNGLKVTKSASTMQLTYLFN